MKLPPGFAEMAVRMPVEGYGGFNRGQFRVGDFAGDFTRVESRLAVFDPLYASNRGGASFTLSGPAIIGRVEAQCSFKQNVATIGIVTFDPKKFAFICDIASADSRLAGQLALGEPRPDGFRQRLLARAARRGIAAFASLDVEIESVHEYEGSRLTSQTPVGYLLRHGSILLGALELTDVNPTIYLSSTLAETEQLATLVAAVAVSLLRDPADSSLGD